MGERKGGWEIVELMILRTCSKYMYLLCVIAMEREGGGGNIEVGQVVCEGRPSMCTKYIPSRARVSYKV